MAAAVKSELEEEEYEVISDYAGSEIESNVEEDRNSDTPVTSRSTPPRNIRPSDRKTLSCPYEGCPKTFNRKARLEEHKRSHTNTRPFKCPHCPKDFLRDSHLKHHVKSAHSDIRDYTCSYSRCGKSFATGTRLRRHEATHAGHDKYRCTGYDVCSQTFRKKETLNKHILQAHQQTNLFPCTEINSKTGEPCKKSFDTARKLKTHKQAMHDPTKFSCSICVQAQTMAYRDPSTTDILSTSSSPCFTSYAALRKHMDAEHPPTCSHCSLKFTTPKELARHIELVHNIVDPELLPQEEAHECPYDGCGRTFSKKGNLNVHVRTVHEKRRDFVCGQTEVSLTEISSEVEVVGCGRDFTSKGSLEEHIRTAHLGMQARRVERNKKRKAERQEVEDEDGVGPKKRKPRKDKGVKKTSAIDSLVGFPLYRLGSIVEADEADSDEDEVSEANSVYDDDEEDDAGLTSSMVMHGSQIFHGDNVYHFDSSSSSFSTQQATGSIYQQWNQPYTESASGPADHMPIVNFDEVTFGHNYDLSHTYEGPTAHKHAYDPTSTMASVDLHRQCSTQTTLAQAAVPASMPEGECYYAGFSDRRNTTTRLSPSPVPVDPRLLN
jgi:general transcription factor IIIA